MLTALEEHNRLYRLAFKELFDNHNPDAARQISIEAIDRIHEFHDSQVASEIIFPCTCRAEKLLELIERNIQSFP